MLEKPTPSGGIIVLSKSGQREWSVEWDKRGKLVSESCKINKGGGCKSKRRAAAPVPLPAPPKQERGLASPGDWFAALVIVVFFGYIRMCRTCKSKRASMNKAGWRGLPRLWWRWLINKKSPGG